MNTMIDLIGASVIAGLILLMVIQLNSSMTNKNMQTTLDAITQSNSKTIADMINYDFYKIGYHDSLTDPKPVIEVADTDRIRFRADIEKGGRIDTVEYYTQGSTYSVPDSPIKFKKLYRGVNGLISPGASLGITWFKFSYYDTAGRQITFPTPTDTGARRNIRSIKVQMMVKNTTSVDTVYKSTYDTTFAAVYWEKWISPKNIRRIK